MYGPIIKKRDDVNNEEPSEVGIQDFETEHATERQSDALGDISVDEDPLMQAPWGAQTGERRPGGGGSSSPTEPVAPEPDTLKGRLNGLKDRFTKKPRQEAPSQPQTKEKRPKVTGKLGRRISAADTLSDGWAGIGSLAMRMGHGPTGRMMQFQAPVAGEMLDEAAKGSFIDRALLQPVVKTRGRFDLLSAVIAPPLLVMAIERDPSKADLLMPVLKSQIRSALPLMVPAIKKVQEKEAKAAEAAAELFPDLPPGEDPADAIIAMLFSDWVPPAPAEPENVTQEEEVAA